MTRSATAGLLTEVARFVREETGRRDRLIHKRRQEGATLRQIASEAGLTAAGVKKILDRQVS